MKGMILIPDISGFTNFVATTDPEVGINVIRELLDTVIDNNPLPVNLSEVEGDALLFYRVGKPLPVRELLLAVAQMNDAFNEKFAELKLKYNLAGKLIMKFIVHFGELAVYEIKRV